VEKVMEVDNHIGTAMSGLIADARTLVDHARIEAQNHRFSYNEPMRTEALAQATCDLMLSFGESGDEKKMSRPFGVALLLAGHDDTGAHLFFCDPSGTYVEYKAKAIGSGSEGAQAQLTEEYSETMSLAEAEVLAVKALKAVMEEKLTEDNIEVARVDARGYATIKGDDLKDLVARIPV
jgi:20S proteasome subunit alpha 5